MGLEEIHGLCCRFLLSADGDVVARLTESVCVTFRNGGRRAVGRNHFTPSSRESGSNIDNYTIFLNITHARTARSSPAFTASCRNWLWGERTGDTPRSFRWCAKSSREPWQLRELDAQLSFPWTHDVTSVAKTAGRELYASVSNSHITDFLRYRSRERRRRALIHGLQEEGEPCGQAKRIHLHQGCNLKILTTPLLLLPCHWQLCDPVNPSDGEDLGRRAPRQKKTKGDHLWPVWSNRQSRAGWRPRQRHHWGILVRGAR